MHRSLSSTLARQRPLLAGSIAWRRGLTARTAAPTRSLSFAARPTPVQSTSALPSSRASAYAHARSFASSSLVPAPFKPSFVTLAGRKKAPRPAGPEDGEAAVDGEEPDAELTKEGGKRTRLDGAKKGSSSPPTAPPASSSAAAASSGSGSSDDPSSGSTPPSADDPPSTSISKRSVPDVYPQVLALPITRRPLFPGFYKAVIIRNPEVVAAVKEAVKRGQPYIGAFLLKDENSDSDMYSFSFW